MIIRNPLLFNPPPPLTKDNHPPKPTVSLWAIPIQEELCSPGSPPQFKNLAANRRLLQGFGSHIVPAVGHLVVFCCFGVWRDDVFKQPAWP